MRSATWCIVFCVFIFLVMSDDGKEPKKKGEPNNLCPRIEDLEGNCKVDGPKGCMNYMRKTYKAKYDNCTCDNIYMLHKTKRFCECTIRCNDIPP
ncbi:hypothetical protein N665_0550s0012 [Sinapis alba]|nr:hypothetical protein N665_0550s0012 [Sinapis alba]